MVFALALTGCGRKIGDGPPEKAVHDDTGAVTLRVPPDWDASGAPLRDADRSSSLVAAADLGALGDFERNRWRTPWGRVVASSRIARRLRRLGDEKGELPAMIRLQEFLNEFGGTDEDLARECHHNLVGLSTFPSEGKVVASRYLDGKFDGFLRRVGGCGLENASWIDLVALSKDRSAFVYVAVVTTRAVPKSAAQQLLGSVRIDAKRLR
jgi:hypothetical protein